MINEVAARVEECIVKHQEPDDGGWRPFRELAVRLDNVTTQTRLTSTEARELAVMLLDRADAIERANLVPSPFIDTFWTVERHKEADAERGRVVVSSAVA